jgi:type I restriction enzyme S subunit
MKEETLNMLMDPASYPFNKNFVAGYFIYEGLNCRFAADSLLQIKVTNEPNLFIGQDGYWKATVVSEKEDGYLCGTGSLFVRFVNKIEPIFIMYIIRAESFTNELVSKAKGATMLNLNSNTIANLLVPLPPLSLQQDFATKISAIEKQKQRISASIKDLNIMLASRMQYWFE